MKTALVLLLLAASLPAAAAETIIDCRYTDAGRKVVQCTVDGRVASIPVQPGNRHWDRILRDQISVGDPQ